MGLDSVEIVLLMEEHFEIDISNSEAEAIYTVGHLVDLIRRKLAENGQRSNPAVIGPEVLRLVADFTGIKVGKISLSSRFIEDLKVD